MSGRGVQQGDIKFKHREEEKQERQTSHQYSKTASKTIYMMEEASI